MAVSVRMLMVLLLCAGPMIGAGAALARDERRAERVTADDDPILIPRSAVDPRALDLAILDPETTGSVKKQVRPSRLRCSTLAWFPDRLADQEFRETC